MDTFADAASGIHLHKYTALLSVYVEGTEASVDGDSVADLLAPERNAEWPGDDPSQPGESTLPAGEHGHD